MGGGANSGYLRSFLHARWIGALLGARVRRMVAKLRGANRAFPVCRWLVTGKGAITPTGRANISGPVHSIPDQGTSWNVRISPAAQRDNRCRLRKRRWVLEIGEAGVNCLFARPSELGRFAWIRRSCAMHPAAPIAGEHMSHFACFHSPIGVLRRTVILLPSVMETCWLPKCRGEMAIPAPTEYDIRPPAPPRAMRDSRYRKSLAAVKFIETTLSERGRLPSVQALLAHTGGSMRDAQRIHASASQWVANVVRLAITTHSVAAAENLTVRVRALEEENARLRGTAQRLEVEYDGLRRHLLKETVRLRDEFVKSVGATMPHREVVKRHLPYDGEGVFEE